MSFVMGSLSPLLGRAGVALLKFVTAVCFGSTTSYRPEDHYMRGPGPKWREKHGLVAGRSVNTQS